MTEKMVKMASHGHYADPKATKYPHFIKFILQSAIEDKKMIIPPKFVMLFGDTLSDVAELSLPGDCIWRVGLQKESKSICFDNNWHEFVEHHSIRQGYMLLFLYEGSSKFNVHIFDHSYCEIHEHRKPVASLMLVNKEVDVSTKQDLTQENLIENEEKKSIAVFGREEIFASEDTGSKREKVSLETGGAIEAANMFKPENPSFTVVLKSYNINNFVYVKTGFSSAYLRGVSDSIRVENPEGKGRLVKVIRKPNNLLMLTAGWRAFVQENHLQQGDVCVFEVIKLKNVAFKVSMFPQSPLPAPEEMQNLKKKKEKQVNLEKKSKITNGLNQGKSTALGMSGSSKFDCAKHPPKFAKSVSKGSTVRASNGDTCNPSFMLMLKSYSSNPPFVRVPHSFAKKYLRRECVEIKVKDPVGREWKVKLGWGVNIYQGPYLNGWSQLAKANGFKAGDVCNFQYVNAKGKEPFLNVSVCDESSNKI